MPFFPNALQRDQFTSFSVMNMQQLMIALNFIGPHGDKNKLSGTFRNQENFATVHICWNVYCMNISK